MARKSLYYIGGAVAVLTLAGLLSVTLPALWEVRRSMSRFREVVQRPPSVPLREVAPVLVDCLIASEDGNFYRHHGVDWQALHRALRVNLRSWRFQQGGSTLTMQTARYLFLGREKSLSRKLAEVLLALEMERLLCKERIVELYLNSARFGLGAEEVGTACRVYFGKEPRQLRLAEAAFLAGVLPEPPRRREELTVEKVERCKRRALRRLAHFLAGRYPPGQIEQAMRERLVLAWERGAR
jgi:penicillin-binding protein 1A